MKGLFVLHGLPCRLSEKRISSNSISQDCNGCSITQSTPSLRNTVNQKQIEGKLSDEKLWVLDSELRMLLEICGGCERIKTTLMPISWRFVTWQCICIYLLVMPWGLVDNFGIWTIPLTVLAAYFVIAAEFIAHYVEEPFGIQEDHLDIEKICNAIDDSVSEILLEET